MSKSSLFKSLLIAQTIGLLTYTLFAFQNDSANLFSVYINNILSFNWNGQFNLDFSCYLFLSALWIVWRNKFNISSFIIGIAAMIVGIMVFAPYLLVLLIKEKGDLYRVLVGKR